MKKHYNTKTVFLAPLFVALILLIAMISSYMRILNSDIDDEYRNANTMMMRAGKIVVALDYGFTNYFESPSIMSTGFVKSVADGLCRIVPKESMLLTNKKASSSPPISISYMMVGDESLCDEAHPLYDLMRRKVSLAPIISFLNDLDNYIIGVHYIDNAGYIISAPDSVLKDITKERLMTVKLREFWQKAADNPDIITVTGPSAFSEVLHQKNTMTLAMPVYMESNFIGVVALDISVGRLIDDSSRLTDKIRLVRSEELPKDGSVYRPHKLEISYTKMDHYLYYQWNWAAEISRFVKEKQTSVYALVLAYLVSVVGMFYFNTRIEKSYYENLASRDPMTGLLNRRGMEEFLQVKQHSRYLSVAVLDIDNFKSINDTYGHDVGDDVICYVGDQIECNIRETDAVARFGGEEFVVYLTSPDPLQIEAVMQRVKEAITRDSTRVVPNGFTISGGIQVIESHQEWDFDKQFKLADEKLYLAKTTGKDKLVF